MGKWQSKSISLEESLGNGRVKPGKTVLIPLDDAAKVHPLAQSAFDAGYWVPADPKEIEKAKARVQEKELLENKRRGV